MINLSDYHLDFLNCPNVSFSSCLCVSFSVRVSFLPRISTVHPFRQVSGCASFILTRPFRQVATLELIHKYFNFKCHLLHVTYFSCHLLRMVYFSIYEITTLI